MPTYSVAVRFKLRNLNPDINFWVFNCTLTHLPLISALEKVHADFGCSTFGCVFELKLVRDRQTEGGTDRTRDAAYYIKAAA